jgi:hypothetical protein
MFREVTNALRACHQMLAVKRRNALLMSLLCPEFLFCLVALRQQNR